jgi:hypothetical protein
VLFNGSSVKGVVSTNPADTIASVATSPSNVTVETVLCVIGALGGTSGIIDVEFPLVKNQNIFLSSGGAGSFVLFFEDSAV